MSGTLKAALTALKSRIADAYTAISSKGGTLPATQDSANLPTAIASIPSGGNGLFYNMNDFGVPNSIIEKLNAYVDDDLAASLPYLGDNTTLAIPYIVCQLTADRQTKFGDGRSFQGDKKAVLIYLNGGAMFSGYYCFYQCYPLQYLIIGDVTRTATSMMGCFYTCYSLRAIIGTLVITRCSNYANNFTGCYNLKEAKIDYQVDHDFTISDPPLNLSSLIFLLDHLVTSTNSSTLTIGSNNLATLNASADGQTALAAAAAKGWNIA